MSIKGRIQMYLDFKSINNNAFEKSISHSKGYWSKTKNISSESLAEIVRVYSDISPEWLLTGNGDMLRQNTIKDDANVLRQDISKPLLYDTISRDEFEKLRNEYLNALQKLTHTQEMLIDTKDKFLKAQIEINELHKEIEDIKDQGGGIVVSA